MVFQVGGKRDEHELVRLSICHLQGKVYATMNFGPPTHASAVLLTCCIGYDFDATATAFVRRMRVVCKLHSGGITVASQL